MALSSSWFCELGIIILDEVVNLDTERSQHLSTRGVELNHTLVASARYRNAGTQRRAYEPSTDKNF